MRSKIAKKVYEETPQSTKDFVRFYASLLKKKGKSNRGNNIILMFLYILLLLSGVGAFSQSRNFEYQSYYNKKDSTMDVLGVDGKSILTIKNNKATLYFGKSWVDMTISDSYEDSQFLQYCGRLTGQSERATLTINQQKHFAMLVVNGDLYIELFGKVGFTLDFEDK